jgi:hypothetical protein
VLSLPTFLLHVPTPCSLSLFLLPCPTPSSYGVFLWRLSFPASSPSGAGPGAGSGACPAAVSESLVLVLVLVLASPGVARAHAHARARSPILLALASRRVVVRFCTRTIIPCARSSIRMEHHRPPRRGQLGEVRRFRHSVRDRHAGEWCRVVSWLGFFMVHSARSATLHLCTFAPLHSAPPRSGLPTRSCPVRFLCAPHRDPAGFASPFALLPSSLSPLQHPLIPS